LFTNDGVSILEEMQIEHPAAKMMVEIARTQRTKLATEQLLRDDCWKTFRGNAEKLLTKRFIQL
jgi:hypothetical protein